jgi:hypothetical protein
MRTKDREWLFTRYHCVAASVVVVAGGRPLSAGPATWRYGRHRNPG